MLKRLVIGLLVPTRKNTPTQRHQHLSLVRVHAPSAGSRGAVTARRLAAVMIAATAVAFTSTAALGQAGQVGSDGWTELAPQSDSRIVYVSSSAGVSASEARIYSRTDPEVGADPFNPVGPIVAFASLNDAQGAMRNGKPDWMLLRRGDVWEESFNAPKWHKGGRGPGEYMLIGAYRDGPGTARPVIDEFDTRYGAGQWESHFNWLAIVGIEFRVGLDRRIGGTGFLIEDCYFHECPILIQGFGPEPGVPHLFEVAIRRTIVYRNYKPTGHSQNMFVALTHDLLIEECVFDHGGWHPVYDPPDQLSHNVYLQVNTTGVVFRRNISARASSHGVQMRTGGVCEDNLFMQNPINILFGSSALSNWPEGAAKGSVHDNVVLDSRDIGTLARGFGIWADEVDQVTITRNIIAHQRNASDGKGMHFGANYRGLRVHDNIVHDWPNPVVPTNGGALSFAGTPRGNNNRIHNNLLQHPEVGRVLNFAVPLDSFVIYNNQYYTGNHPSDWFRPGSDFEGWVAISGDTGSQTGYVNLPDPSRDIQSYLASQGIQGDLERFMEEARNQSQHNWRPQFTAAAVNAYIREGFGQSQSTNATLTDLEIQLGTLLEGNVNRLKNSNNQYVRVASAFGFSAMDPHNVQIMVGASMQNSASTLRLDVEQSASIASGVARFSLRNWQTDAFEEVWTGSVGLTELVRTVTGLQASRYRKSGSGRIEVRIRHSAVATFSATGFTSNFDWVRIRSN